LSTYLAAAKADTTTTWSSSALSTLATFKRGWYYGSDSYGLYYIKISDAQTAKACTWTWTFYGQLSGISATTGTCTTSWDSTTSKHKHACTCALNPKTGVSSCDFMMQWAGVSSYSVSYSYGYSCTTV